MAHPVIPTLPSGFSPLKVRGVFRDNAHKRQARCLWFSYRRTVPRDVLKERKPIEKSTRMRVKSYMDEIDT
jgi:hypothetical protein